MLYILKIKGTNKIPDFVQIRDFEMTLIAYFRLNQVTQGLKKKGLEKHAKEITSLLERMPYGRIHKYLSENG
ncbi:MAG: fructose-6-phosphate aldolase [Flavobacteriales bacterium]|nr:fructose-6-phosphate aldolase [Flavobacteriales bacterium]